MLDVHLPHKSLHGFREFFLHLFTITVGLLIATQIESFVEWRHHVHLAEEARASLRKEIASNVKYLQMGQTGLKQWQTETQANLAILERMEDQPKDSKGQPVSLMANATITGAFDTAWKTAQSTGALAYMPYEEAQRYSLIYMALASLKETQGKPLEDMTAISGLAAKFHMQAGDTTIVAKQLTADQASALAEKYGQLDQHLGYASLTLNICIETSQAFLQNRTVPTVFSQKDQ